jgi:hypothetical protein
LCRFLIRGAVCGKRCCSGRSYGGVLLAGLQSPGSGLEALGRSSLSLQGPLIAGALSYVCGTCTRPHNDNAGWRGWRRAKHQKGISLLAHPRLSPFLCQLASGLFWFLYRPALLVSALCEIPMCAAYRMCSACPACWINVVVGVADLLLWIRVMHRERLPHTAACPQPSLSPPLFTPNVSGLLSISPSPLTNCGI